VGRGGDGNFCKLSALGARLDERARDQPRKFSAWRDGPGGRLSLKLETGRNYIARQKHEASRARYGPRTESWDTGVERMGEERGSEARGKNAFFYSSFNGAPPSSSPCDVVCLAAITCSKFSRAAWNFRVEISRFD